MLDNLRKLRNLLLENNLLNVYKNILYFFENPYINDVERIVNSLQGAPKDDVRDILHEVINLYETKISKYRDEIIYGQYLIWDQVLICYEKLCDIRTRIKMFNLNIFTDDYLSAVDEVKKISKCYSEAQSEMTSFESILGVDRYLDRLCYTDIKPLEDILSEIKSDFESKLAKYKDIFVNKWSTTNVAPLISHELLRYDGDNQICTLFECNKRNIVLFIIDGFGYSQYQWHKNINNGAINYTYNENIFNWLEKVGCIKEYVLGSSYITDTSAGLAQIFTGKSQIETGIISSKVRIENSASFMDTKRLDSENFNKIFNTENISISQLVKIFNKKSKVFYGSRYGGNISGFSEFIFRGAEVFEIIPSERSFVILKDELYKKEEGLYVVYLTNIDNSGHTMGAYSQFEKFEHEKFNMLLRNFLIEVASENQGQFDGKTTFIFTADHGMAESSKFMINRKIIKEQFNRSNLNNVRFVENNRAMLVYGLQSQDYFKANDILVEYFNDLNVDVDILIKGTESYSNWYCTDIHNKISKLAPDIVIRLISSGLFYSKDTSHHLLHYGGHGGASAGEIFVPLLQITLDNELYSNIQNRFINII